MVTKTQKRVFEFFGDLRRRPYFVFYKLREVLIPEFGDLILQIGGDYFACGREGSELASLHSRAEKSTRRIFGPSDGSKLCPAACELEDWGTPERRPAVEAIDCAVTVCRVRLAPRNYFAQAHKLRITLARRWTVWKDLCAVDADQIRIWCATAAWENAKPQ